jgi:DNA polymerase alpha subunit A
LEEEEDVYEEMDEEEYNAHVESKRNQEDFVVDDDGNGYVDNGEEWIGATEDEKQKKKRSIKEAGMEDDKKLTKNARKLAEAGNQQQGAMRNFARAGVSEANKKTAAAAAMRADDLDIDDLLGVNPRSRAGGAQRGVVGPLVTKPKQRLPAKKGLYGNDKLGLGVHNPLVPASVTGTDQGDYYESAEYNEPPPADMDVATDGAADAAPSYQSKSLAAGAGAAARRFKIKAENEAAAAEAGGDFGTGHFKSFFDDSADASTAAASAVDSAAQSQSQADSQAESQGATKASDIDPRSYITKNEDGSTSMDFYYMDATEINGVIYLFGKVKIADDKYVSCVVSVLGCERNLFVLPRATGQFKEDGTAVRASFQEVYEEISKVLVPSVVPRKAGEEFKVKAVQRNYTFDDTEVPREYSQYMKIKYSAKYGVPTPEACSGGKTYQKIFGASSSGLELFLLKRKLKGPSWITITNPRMVPNKVSWAKLEVGVELPKHVSTADAQKKLAVPPLVSMSVSMKTCVNPRTHQHEIVAISGLVYTKLEAEQDTTINGAHMRRFTFMRPLGSLGPSYPTKFPHDLEPHIKKKNAHRFFETFGNERAMLTKFLIKVQTEDPDIMASHNLFGFEFDVILNRAADLKVSQWDRLGRLKKSKPPRNINDPSLAGRLFVDTYKASKEFLRETTYSLTNLTETQLKKKRFDVDPVDVPKFFTSSQDIFQMYLHTENDTLLVQGLMMKLQVIPLTKQLTNISGNLWSRTLKGARAERIEFLLLHQFHETKYILPEKKSFGADKGSFGKGAKGGAAGLDDEDDQNAGKVGGSGRSRAKAAYAGGLVLEPKKGLYDNMILLLDFNSLYPSIIQEYNLCFTTVDYGRYSLGAGPAAGTAGGSGSGKSPAKAPEDEDEDEGEGDITASAAAFELPPIPDQSSQAGILPRVIKGLVERRKAVKSLLKNEKDPAKRQSLDIRQKALKLTANSMYGCLGFTFSRFYAKPIAALITSKGREALQRTVDLAEREMNLDVIYGDTDSVMINSNSRDYAEVLKLGNQVKAAVNKLYTSLELDVDGIFSSMLLLKKKKYAAVVVSQNKDGSFSYEKELKGLDLVRRDWCNMSKDTGKWVVDQILSGKPREEIVSLIHDHMEELAKRVRAGEVDVSEFIVRKGLNKNPKDYPDAKGQPHLVVALQMLKAQKPVNIGDHIPYVICNNVEVEGAEGGAAKTAVKGENGEAAPAAAQPQNGRSKGAAERAHHPDDVIRAEGKLQLDFEWYLTQQILPPISRLCEPIEGTSTMLLSTKLGLDSSKFQQRDDFENDQWSFVPKCQMEDSDRFRKCEKLTYCCRACNVGEQEFMGTFNEQTKSSGLLCGACGAMYMGRKDAADCYSYLSNRITLLVRSCLKKYYDCWLCCDDSSCSRRTMQQSAMGFACTENCHGRMIPDYSDEQLHTQLKYLESLFDVERSVKRFAAKKEEQEKSMSPEDLAAKKNAELESANNHAVSGPADIPREHKDIYRLLNTHMTHSVERSDFNWIDPKMWSFVFGSTTATTAAATTKPKLVGLSAR